MPSMCHGPNLRAAAWQSTMGVMLHMPLFTISLPRFDPSLISLSLFHYRECISVAHGEASRFIGDAVNMNTHKIIF